MLEVGGWFVIRGDECDDKKVRLINNYSCSMSMWVLGAVRDVNELCQIDSNTIHRI